MLNQTTIDDSVVTPSKLKDNVKETSIEDIQRRKKDQIESNFYLREKSKRKEANSSEILPKGHNRDQHQSEKLNNQVQTINITNCNVNIKMLNPDCDEIAIDSINPQNSYYGEGSKSEQYLANDPQGNSSRQFSGIFYYGFIFNIFRNTFKLLQISKFNIFRLK